MHKTTLKIIFGLLIFFILLCLGGLVIYNRLYPGKLPLNQAFRPASPQKQLNLYQQGEAVISLVTPKTAYEVGEEIPVEILIDPRNLPIVAIEVALNYSPNLNFVGYQAETTLPNLTYQQNQNNSEKQQVQISALSNPQQTLYLQEPTVFARMIFKVEKEGPIQFDFDKPTGLYAKGQDFNYLKTAAGLKLTTIQ